MGFNFGFFGTQEHRVFSYKPRYYDVKKAEREEMFGNVDGSKEKEEYVPGSTIRGSFTGNDARKPAGATLAQKIIGGVGLILFFVVLIYIARAFSIVQWN